LKDALRYFRFDMDNLIADVIWHNKALINRDAIKLNNRIRLFLLIAHCIGENEDMVSSEDFVLQSGTRKNDVKTFKKKLCLAQKNYDDELSKRLDRYEASGVDASNEKDILQALLGFSEEKAIVLVRNVLNDSEEDPHFSAVSATSRIFLLTELYHAIGMHPELTDLRSYLTGRGFSDSEYEFFEGSRKRESVYYSGKHYNFPTSDNG